MPEGSLLKLILMLIFLVFSAFFSSSETAFTSFNHTKMKNLANEGNKRAQLVLKMSENYDKLLSTILVGNNIVNIALSSIATIWFMELLISTPLAHYYTAISTIVITVIVLIFGEISPKSLAKERPESFAMGVCRILRVVTVLLMPINFFFMMWKKLLTKVFKPAEVEAVTEGEVLTLIDEAHEDGSIDEYNKELIENIFEFDDLSAGAIATHRTEMTILAQDGTAEEWEEIINNSRFSRYPVYGEDVDDIIGVLDAREYFRLEDKSRETVMETAVHPAYFVPETVKADVLFRNMKKNKESLAIVLDEYGGVQGIITFTDLVECLVGEFAETDTKEEPILPIVRLDENQFEINGPVAISEVEDALGIILEDCDSDTFGGFVLGLYGSIPEDGSTFTLSTKQMDIELLEIREHRLAKARITLKATSNEDDTDEQTEKKAVKEAAEA